MSLTSYRAALPRGNVGGLYQINLLCQAKSFCAFHTTSFVLKKRNLNNNAALKIPISVANNRTLRDFFLQIALLNIYGFYLPLSISGTRSQALCAAHYKHPLKYTGDLFQLYSSGLWTIIR
jgi:hypothetical protein